MVYFYPHYQKWFICFNTSAKGITTMYSSKIEQGNFADLLFFLLPFTLVDCGLVYAFSFSFEQEYFICFDFVNIGIKSKLMKQTLFTTRWIAAFGLKNFCACLGEGQKSLLIMRNFLFMQYTIYTNVALNNFMPGQLLVHSSLYNMGEKIRDCKIVNISHSVRYKYSYTIMYLMLGGKAK